MAANDLEGKELAGPESGSRYVVGPTIGVGGMATVHRAKRFDPPGSVALKVLHPHLAADASVVKAIRVEALVASKLNHPNVVRIHEVLELEGAPALVMDWVDGGSLLSHTYAAWNRDEPIPQPVVVAIVADLLRALAAAHGAADPIIHRDVSPHNVLLTRDGVAMLSDFGIARIGDRTGSTTQGMLKGKLSYMAPELFASKPASVRSDLYATGVITWELLAGERLFEGDVAEVLGKMMTLDRSSLSLATRGVPAPLSDVVARAIDPEPSRRFASADEMRNAMAEAMAPAPHEDVATWIADVGLAGPPSVASRSSAPPPARAVGSRRGLVLGGVVVVAVAATAALALSARNEGAGPIPTTAEPARAGPTATAEETAPSPPPAPIASTAAPTISATAEAAPTTSASAQRTRPKRTFDRSAAQRQATDVWVQARLKCNVQMGAFAITYSPQGGVSVNQFLGDTSPCATSYLASNVKPAPPFDGPAQTLTVGASGGSAWQNKP